MRIALLFAAATLIAGPALANELVASNGKDSIRLLDKPCTIQPVLSRLKPGLAAALKEATAVVQGQPFKACWIVNGRDAHLLYEDGDQGLVPLSDFKAPISA